MIGTSVDEDHTRVIPEFMDKNPFDVTRGQVIWLACCSVIFFVSAFVSLWPAAVASLIFATFAYQTYEGIVYERILELPQSNRNRKAERTGTAFFEPPADDEVVQIDEGAKDVRGKRVSRRRDYSTPFTSQPVAIMVPGFGDVPRGIMYDSSSGKDSFFVSCRGWSITNLDLAHRDWREKALANVMKEALSELDGGIEFKYIVGTRPRNIYPSAHERMLKSRREVLDAVENLADVPTDPQEQSPAQTDALLIEELISDEMNGSVDSIQVIEFKVPRPTRWDKILRKRGYLTESDIENSPLALVMKAAYEGLKSLEVTGVEVLDMPSMFTQVRRHFDIGGIDDFLRDMHLASLLNEGEHVPWHELLKDHNLWPKRIPRYGRNYILTDQTLHQVIRLYRFRIRRVLPGFMQSLLMLTDPDHRWWFTFSYVAQSTSANRETSWLTNQIVFREGLRRVFKTGEYYETMEQQEHRDQPRQQQNDLYQSRGPAIKANRYLVISVPLPALGDDMDKDEQLEIGLRTMRLARGQAYSMLRRMRIVPRIVTRHRQLRHFSDAII